jgi:hypothetical protein
MRKTLLLVVLMLAVFSGAAFAQDVPPTFCGDLSEADCSILTESAQAMRELSSAAFNFQLDVNVANIPDPTMSDLSFRLTGDGAYAVDPATLSALTMSPTDMMANMDKLPQMMQDLIKAISADANLVLYLPPNLPTGGQPLPEKVGVSLRLVDGFGYVNLDKLAELDTSGNMPKGWIGFDLASFLQQAMAQMGSMSTMPGMGTMNMDAMGMFSNPEFIGQFTTISRGADASVDGQNAAVFTTAVDLGALYGSEEFQQYMRDQVEAAMGTSGSSSGISAQQMDAIMGMYSTMFKGFVVNSTQTIGLDDHYIHQTGITLDWSLDLNSMMASMMGGMGGNSGSSASTMEPINIAVNFQGGLSQFNSAPTITAPEDAQIVPLEQMLGRRS